MAPSRKEAAVSISQPKNGKKRALSTQNTLTSRKKPSLPHARKFTRNVPPSRKLKVFVFGEGSCGELGLGPVNATEVARPRINQHLGGVVSIAPGSMHAAALASSSKILTWGINDEGALGRDTSWDGGLRDVEAEDSDSCSDQLNPIESTPTEVPAHHFPKGTTFSQVAAGDSTTFVLSTDGLVYGWGTFRDDNGRLGFTLDSTTGKAIEIQIQPKLVPGLKNIVQITVGNNFALALDDAGRIFAWGCGDQCELGRRLVKRRRLLALLPASVALPKRTRIVSVHAAANHAFAIDSEGDTWSWGSNNFGQTGFRRGAGEGGSTICPPQKVPALQGIPMKMVDGGLHHSIGLTQSGECLVWGRTDGFQMGLRMTALALDNPSQVIADSRGRPRILLKPTSLPLPPCVHVSTGSDHCFAVTAEGKAYSWGFNVTYQCGQGTTDDVEVATLMNGKQIRDEKLCWAGGGGQYGMLASYM